MGKPDKNTEVLRRLDHGQGRTFEVVKGNLLTEPTDAIVNAANSHLAHGAGVARAIADEAGYELVEEGNSLVRERGLIPVGEAAITTAGLLPFKGVIHAVGPRMGEGGEQDKLTSALVAAFEKAHERKWESVSFPGVSSGIFSVPHDICAAAYFEAVERFWISYENSSLNLIRLVLFEGSLLQAVLTISDTGRI